MDFMTDIALTVLLRTLKDKKASMKIRAALLKVFRAIWTIFSDDPDFRKVIFPGMTEP